MRIVNVFYIVAPRYKLVRVTDVRKLEPADHIKWRRISGIEHHAIVEYVDYRSGTVHIIEYGSGDEGSGFGKGVVRRNTVGDVKGMYKYVYEYVHYYHYYREKESDVAEVLERAKSRLGERKYNPLTNNCEHFASWCKTGREYSSQTKPRAWEVITGRSDSTRADRVVSTGAKAGGIIAGAGIGAAIGSIVPGPGTVIGAAVGGVIGHFCGSAAGRAINNERPI